MARAQVRDFLAERKELVFGDEDDPITIVYRPARVNAEFTRMLKSFEADPDGESKVLVFIVCTLVSDWNITGPLIAEDAVLDRKGKPMRDDYGVPVTTTRTVVEDGQKVPIKSETVRYVSMLLLGEIWNRITEDMAPDPKSGTPS